MIIVTRVHYIAIVTLAAGRGRSVKRHTVGSIPALAVGNRSLAAIPADADHTRPRRVEIANATADITGIPVAVAGWTMFDEQSAFFKDIALRACGSPEPLPKGPGRASKAVAAKRVSVATEACVLEGVFSAWSEAPIHQTAAVHLGLIQLTTGDNSTGRRSPLRVESMPRCAAVVREREASVKLTACIPESGTSGHGSASTAALVTTDRLIADDTEAREHVTDALRSGPPTRG